MWGPGQGAEDGLTQTNNGDASAQFHMVGSQYVAPGAISWNANVVRLEMSDVFWCATDIDCNSPGPEHTELIGSCGDLYRQKVAENVERLTSRGALVLLDLHGVPALSAKLTDPDDVFTCDDNPGNNATGILRPYADLAYAPTFWDQVASEYADNPLVAFELFNEPRLTKSTFDCPGTKLDGSLKPGKEPWDVWLNAGMDPQDADDAVKGADDGSGFYRAAGMQLMYNIVRAHADNLVFVGGLGPRDVNGTNQAGFNTACNENAAYDLSPVVAAVPHGVVGENNGPATNLVYASHPYNLTGCTAINPPASIDVAVGAVALQFPVVFTEFGHKARLIDDEDEDGSHCTAAAAKAFNQSIVDYAHGGDHCLGTGVTRSCIGYIGYAFAPWQTNAYALFACLAAWPAGCERPLGGDPTHLQDYLPYEPLPAGEPIYNGNHGPVPKPLN